MSRSTARQEWVVDHLQLTGTEHVLEFGCGPGVAAALVAARLSRGTLLAIDRSAVAVERTASRLAGHPRAEVRRVALAELDTPAAFDVAFGVDVNAFWATDGRGEVDALARALRPGGLLSLCFGRGPTGLDRITSAVRSALAGHPFTTPVVVEGPDVVAIDVVRGE